MRGVEDAERCTKIVATIGPASRSPSTLARLLAAGVDVARLNASHGAAAERAADAAAVRRAALRARRRVAILLDLQGPKIRVGRLERGGPVRLVAGRSIAIEVGEFAGTADRIATSYARLPRDVRRGDSILLDDGLLRLRVERVERTRVRAVVVTGGLLRERKGMNLPGVALSAPTFTAKDRRDLAHGVRLGVDAVALSFVRRAEDVRTLRRALARLGARSLPVIAKIEKPEAVDRIDEILAEADGIMVARGDLGVEIALERVPEVQKDLIAKANAGERLVITATQMLESMVESPVPTRAEASDVANAIFDGTDAVMLSAETAVGRYPVEAARVMASIAREAEAHAEYAPRLAARSGPAAASAGRAIARAACSAALDAGISTIVVLTLSGRSALTLSKMHPAARIVAVAADPSVADRMALYRGVAPLVAPLARTTDEMISNAERALLAAGLARRGDDVILVAGAIAGPGATNMVKLHRLGLGRRRRPQARSAGRAGRGRKSG